VSRACVRFLRLCGVGRRRSPPRLPSDIRCHRRARYLRRKPLVPITSRPRPPFQRHTAKRAAFQKTGMPVAATTRKGFGLANSCRRRIAPPAPSRRLSRSRHPHFFHISVEGALLGIASVTVRSPAIRDGSSTQLVREYRRLFLSPCSCLGLTTQACQVTRPTRPSTGADCPARTDAGRSA
jgi:hypothetical protein